MADSLVARLTAARDAKCDLLDSIIAKLAAAIANPKPNYNVDGQQFDWASYLNWLKDLQTSEIQAITDLENQILRLSPFQFTRRMV